MEMIQVVLFGVVALLVIVVSVLATKQSKLTKENAQLKQILEMKNTTIENYEASSVAVKDVIENFSSLDDVMSLINAGESQASVSEKLGMPVSRIELIIKFDKLKKRD